MSSAHNVSAAAVIPGESHWRALVITYGVIDLFAAFGMLLVLVTCALTKRLRRNPVLLNFHLMFFVTALGDSLIILAGHANDRDPPWGICFASAIFIHGAALGKAVAAFALTCQVWAHIMMLDKPNSRVLRTLASPRLLLPLPWVLYIIVLFTSAAVGATSPNLLSRSSVYYCQIPSVLLEFVDYIPAVLFELGTLVFAAWIAISIIRVRSRVAAHATRSDPVHRALAVRTSIFGLALFVALLLEVTCIVVGPKLGPAPGLILAVIDLTAFIVFACDPILLQAFARRIRMIDDTMSRSAATGGRVAVSVHVATSGPLRDDEEDDTWDSPGATSLRTFRKGSDGTIHVEEKAGPELKAAAL